MDNRYKSRKLLVFLAAFFIACGFLYAKLLTGAEWVEFSKWALLIYAGGNVGSHFANRIGGNNVGKD